MHLGPAEPSGHVADDVTAGTVSADTKFASVIVDGNCDGVFTVDRARIITSFNRAGEATTGFTAREAVGRCGFEIFRTEVCHKRCALRDSLASHGPVENARVTMITQEGCAVPISVSTTILPDEDGQVMGGVEFFRDLTEVEHLRTQRVTGVPPIPPVPDTAVRGLPRSADAGANRSRSTRRRRRWRDNGHPPQNARGRGG